MGSAAGPPPIRCFGFKASSELRDGYYTLAFGSINITYAGSSSRLRYAQLRTFAMSPATSGIAAGFVLPLASRSIPSKLLSVAGASRTSCVRRKSSAFHQPHVNTAPGK